MAPLAAAIASPLLAAATGLFGLRVVLSKVGSTAASPHGCMEFLRAWLADPVSGLGK